MGKHKLALSVLEKGLRRHPKLGSALTLKGRVLASLGRTEEAREILKHRVESDPDNLLARDVLVGLPPDPTELPTLPPPTEQQIEEAETAYLQRTLTLMREDEKAQTGPDALDSQTGGIAPDAESGPRIDKRTVETLEKWLNNASKMMKG
jgi:tetratricopeptide (TPR) repeat protein